jgi:hypothetical protein
MKRSIAVDAGTDTDTKKRICNRTVTHVYAYAITSDGTWHTYSECSNVSDCLHMIVAELTTEVEKFGMKLHKVRWQPRAYDDIRKDCMVTYSSIIVFVDDVSGNPSQPVSTAIKSCLFDYFTHHAPLHNEHNYVLRDMTISDGVAFIECPRNAYIDNCDYHNEWFSQPIGELVSWNGSEENTLHIFECMDGKVNVFRGNNVNDSDACVVMCIGNDNKLIRYPYRELLSDPQQYVKFDYS